MLPSARPRSMVLPFCKWLLVVCSLLVIIPVAFLTGCQSKLLYFPRAYPPGVPAWWAKETKGKPLDYTTSQGRQRAFLLGNRTNPEHLWIVCAGNATLALEWSPWLRANAPGNDAWLLVDFPGYGDCEGSPSPGRIRESFNQVLPIAAAELDWSLPADSGKLRFFGHSLGGAACLIAASDHHIQQGVLVSPFTSTMDMARQVVGLPVGFLIWHRFDNAARLDELAAAGPAKIVILHGTADEVIPVEMGRWLAARHSGMVTLHEIKGGRHNDVNEVGRAELIEAIREAGR